MTIRNEFSRANGPKEPGDVACAQTQTASLDYEQGLKDGWAQGVEASKDMVNEVFEHHQPDHEQFAGMREIREQAKSLVRCMIRNAPASADRSAAIRKVREAVMTVNASVALRGRSI